MNLPPQVRILQPQFLGLLNEVALVRLHVGRWRGRARLTPEDLGIPRADSQSWESIVQLGQKILLPVVPSTSPWWNPEKPSRTYVDVLASIEQSARHWVTINSRQVHWGRIVFLVNLPRLQDEIETYKRDYFKVRDELAATEEAWQAHLARLKAAFENLDHDSAKRIGKLLGVEPKPLNLWEGIHLLIPSREEFFGSFYWELETSMIDVSRWVEESYVKKAVDELKKDPRGVAVAQVYQRVAEEQRQRLSKLRDEFLRDVSASLSSLVYESALEILAAIQEQGDLGGRSATKLRKLFDELSSSFLADEDARAMAARVKEILETPPKERSLAEVDQVLRNIAIVTRNTLLSLKEAPRHPREIKVELPPDEDAVVRRARIALDCPLFDEMAVERRRQNGEN